VKILDARVTHAQDRHTERKALCYFFIHRCLAQEVCRSATTAPR
jgi:hypothetical protein